VKPSDFEKTVEQMEAMVSKLAAQMPRDRRLDAAAARAQSDDPSQQFFPNPSSSYGKGIGRPTTKNQFKGGRVTKKKSAGGGKQSAAKPKPPPKPKSK